MQCIFFLRERASSHQQKSRKVKIRERVCIPFPLFSLPFAYEASQKNCNSVIDHTSEYTRLHIMHRQNRCEGKMAKRGLGSTLSHVKLNRLPWWKMVLWHPPLWTFLLSWNVWQEIVLPILELSARAHHVNTKHITWQIWSSFTFTRVPLLVPKAKYAQIPLPWWCTQQISRWDAP